MSRDRRELRFERLIARNYAPSRDATIEERTGGLNQKMAVMTPRMSEEATDQSPPHPLHRRRSSMRPSRGPRAGGPLTDARQRLRASTGGGSISSGGLAVDGLPFDRGPRFRIAERLQRRLGKQSLQMWFRPCSTRRRTPTIWGVSRRRRVDQFCIRAHARGTAIFQPTATRHGSSSPCASRRRPPIRGAGAPGRIRVGTRRRAFGGMVSG